MNTICLDDLTDCDLVPCAGCGKLHHHIVLDGDLHCDDCCDDNEK